MSARRSFPAGLRERPGQMRPCTWGARRAGRCRVTDLPALERARPAAAFHHVLNWHSHPASNSMRAMPDQVTAALIALAAALGVTSISAILGLRLWESQKLNAVQPLTEERIKRYTEIWRLTDVGTKDQPKRLSPEQRTELAMAFRRWYYEQAGGLLLSEDARIQWTAAVNQLERQKPTPGQVRLSISCLRTRLKQDVHVHDPDIDDAECRNEEGWTDRRLFARWRSR